MQREFLEEIGHALTDARLAGVAENIFRWNGTTQHETVFIFTASVADDAGYEIDEQVIRDSRGRVRVAWRPPGSGGPPLYPEGAADVAARLSRKPAEPGGG